MKKIAILLLLTATNILQAQEDIIPISPNGVWTMQGGSWVLDQFVYYPPVGIGIESVVAVNDTNYFQFSSFDFCDGSTVYSPYFLIREDMGKYYFRNDEADVEQLWFDFTLEVGDTIFLEHCYQDIMPDIISPEQLTVLNIEPTILDNGSIRRKWTLQYSNIQSGMYLMTEEWIEGIGSVSQGWKHPLAQSCIDSGYSMRCYYENGEWVDAFGAFNGAISDTACCDLVGITEMLQATLAISPNPAQKELDVQSATITSSIEVFDQIGRMVFTAHPNSRSTKLNIETLSSGCYFIVVTSEKGVIEAMRFVKN
jgi:Secretion system C-terminal sorting domain